MKLVSVVWTGTELFTPVAAPGAGRAAAAVITAAAAAATTVPSTGNAA